MATTFGTRPEDTVADSRGNVLSGVVLTLYATKADALAQTSPVSTVTTNSHGLWSYSDSSARSGLFVRDPAGNVWAADSEESGATIAGKVDKGSAMLNLRDQTGVVGDGVADDAAAIQTALDSAAALGVRVFARGTFKIGSTVTITGSVDLTDATFNYTGTGTAVQVGNGISGASGILYRCEIALPQIVNANKTGVGTGWTGSTIGVKAVNTYGCTIRVARIKGFVTGYYAYGLGTGNVYNDVMVLHLDNNKRNLVVGAGTGGWSNSNTYRLGLLTHESAEGVAVSGTRNILVETAANLVNGNLFIGGSVEGNVAEYHLDCDGLYNRFDAVRWENSGGCRVIWQSSSSRNVIMYGYTAQSLVETHVSGSSLNRVLSTGMSRIVGSTTKAVQWLENTSSSSAGADAIMDPGATLAGSDPTTAYRILRAADFTKMKRAADTNDRLMLDHTNGRVYFGNAAGAIAMYLAAVSTSGVKLDGGNLYMSPDNTYDIGAASLRPRDVFVGRDLNIGGKVGFYGTTAAVKPTVTGSRGGNAALASLLTALAGLGLITDSSTA